MPAVVISFVGTPVLLLVVVTLVSLRSTIPAASFYVVLPVEGCLAVVVLLIGLSSLRAGTLRMWDDRLVYHSVFGKRTYAKQDIVSVGEGTMPFPTKLSEIIVGAYLWKPDRRRLYLALADKRVVWLKEFSAPPNSERLPQYERSPVYTELLLVVSEIDDWLMGRPRSSVRPPNWT